MLGMQTNSNPQSVMACIKTCYRLRSKVYIPRVLDVSLHFPLTRAHKVIHIRLHLNYFVGLQVFITHNIKAQPA